MCNLHTLTYTVLSIRFWILVCTVINTNCSQIPGQSHSHWKFSCMGLQKLPPSLTSLSPTQLLTLFDSVISTHLGVRSYVCTSLSTHAFLFPRRRTVVLFWALNGSTQPASLATSSGSQLPHSLRLFCQLSHWYHVGCICHVYICFSELSFPTSVFVKLCVCLFIVKLELFWCILENSSLPDVCLANVFFQCMAS